MGLRERRCEVCPGVAQGQDLHAPMQRAGLGACCVTSKDCNPAIILWSTLNLLTSAHNSLQSGNHPLVVDLEVRTILNVHIISRVFVVLGTQVCAL